MEFDRKMLSKTSNNVRMAGFLEKKGKMKLMSQWKKYWFVLEERLLLYYRSEIEYTNLSPCRGSLNMGLVTTVRPGSSSGPCIIHVITRTQAVQLRAKNRATQEEWLQALLHSMALPLVSKTLKPHVEKKSFLGYGCSLDNISFDRRLKHGDLDNEWTLPRKLDYRKRQISGTFYGGSLDTAIWSKKFRPVRTPSPNIPKGKMLEKILGFAKESDSMNIVAVRHKSSQLSLCNEEEMKYVGENSDMNEREGNEVRCKVHDENRNHDLYSLVDKSKKKINKTLSDTELNKTQEVGSLDYVKVIKKDESPFERIKNALSRIPKEKIVKDKSEVERSRPSKKRRQSFLQKVFRKKDYDIRDYESDASDPLYDTIDHLQEQPRSLIPVIFRQEENTPTEEEKRESVTVKPDLDSLYTQVQKPVVGSKTILPASTMSELKMKLKSRESLEKQDTRFLDDKEVEEKGFRLISEKEETLAPSLPPRRVSRPISPWHDVPTNNAPVSSNKTHFFVHQAVVKFNDSMAIPQIEMPETENESSDLEEDNLRVDLTEPYRESFTPVEQPERKKNDDLSMLLEQLSKITAAPLAEPECTDDNYVSSSESEKFWTKSNFSEPDYDIPRPHRPLSIVISQGNEMISSTEFMGRCDNNSDTSSSFRSMEPDSLEMTEKKFILT